MTGKQILNVIVGWIWIEGKEVATSTMSGISTTLLHLGHTSTQQIPTPLPYTL